MAGRHVPVHDLRELLRHLQTTANDREVQRATGLNRRTIARYRAWATQHALLDPAQALPPLEELQQLTASTLAVRPSPQTVSSLEPHRDLVLQLHAQGVEGAAIRLRLQEQVGFTGSRSAIYRFLQRLDPPPLDVCMRVERAPGYEAQVDFGFAGRMRDPATGLLRKTWAFVMTLASSRHQYVAFVFDQSVPTWIALHDHAFRCFAGVPQRVVRDNLNAGITQACFDDPQVQATHRACAEHDGLLIAPCQPRTPEHKGMSVLGPYWLFRKSRDRNLSDRILMLPGPNKVARFTQPAEEPSRVRISGTSPGPSHVFRHASFRFRKQDMAKTV